MNMLAEVGGARSVLLVEDDAAQRQLVCDIFEDNPFSVVATGSAEDAWASLLREPTRYLSVLLDRRLPDTDGLELLKRIKQHEQLRDVPVILMTGLAHEREITEGIHAGAYYYVTKPFRPAVLLSIVRAAADDFLARRTLRAEMESTSHAVEMLNAGTFHCRTPRQARDLAGLLAKTTAEPTKVVTGLWELLINGIEHGNLGISYEEKSRLLAADRLQDEINVRLDATDYANKKLTVTFAHRDANVEFLVQDEGAGFDAARYLEFDPARATHMHGRGIAMARELSFLCLEYSAGGTCVRAVAPAARILAP